MSANETPKRQTLDQRRAKYAWDQADSASDKGEFATVCKQTSARILNAGLGGALAFALTKQDKHKAVADALAGYLHPLLKEGAREGSTTAGNAMAYLGELLKRDAQTLRRHTDLALALLVWLARLADGMDKAKLKKPEENAE